MERDKIGRSIWQDLAAYFRCDSVGGACLLLCAVSLPLSRRGKRPSLRMMLTDVLSPIVIQISGLVRRPHYLGLVSVCIEFVILQRESTVRTLLPAFEKFFRFKISNSE